jgi:Na+/melibiose symporter-like transporter
MLFAALYSARVLKHDRARQRESQVYIFNLTGFYDIKLALLTTLFSALPLYLLALIGDQHKRRRWQRYALVLLAYVLCVVLTFYSPRAEWDYGIEKATKIECDNRGGNTYRKGVHALQSIVIALPAVWTPLWFIIRNPFNIERLSHSKWLTRARPWFLVTSGTLTLVGMWALLGSFIQLRSQVIDAAGDSDQSNQLGFGQVLALFIWAPLVVALGYTILCE